VIFSNSDVVTLVEKHFLKKMLELDNYAVLTARCWPNYNCI